VGYHANDGLQSKKATGKFGGVAMLPGKICIIPGKKIGSPSQLRQRVGKVFVGLEKASAGCWSVCEQIMVQKGGKKVVPGWNQMVKLAPLALIRKVLGLKVGKKRGRHLGEMGKKCVMLTQV